MDIISDMNMAYSEHARRYLADCGLPKERIYVTRSPMMEVPHSNLSKIEALDIHERLGLENRYFCAGLCGRNVSDKVVKIIQSYTGVVNKMVWRKEV